MEGAAVPAPGVVAIEGLARDCDLVVPLTLSDVEEAPSELESVKSSANYSHRRGSPIILDR
jgi:hypothetical protein